MFDVAEVVQLKEGERVQALVRKHVATILPSLVLSGACIVIPFFFLFTFVRFGSIGIFLFAILVAIGLYVSLKTFFVWDATTFIITNQRLVQVDQRSLWNRAVSEVALTHVRDLQWERRGLRDTLSHTGTIRIKTGSSSSPDLVVRDIPRPEQLLRLVQELRDHHLAGTNVKEEKQEQVMHRAEIQEQLKQATPETLARIEQLLKEQ